MKIAKKYYLDDDIINTIDKVKEEQGLPNGSAAIDYIVRRYKEVDEKEMDMIAEQFLSKLEEKYKNMFTRMRLGISSADKNIQILMELVNTMIAYTYPEDVLQPTNSLKASMYEQAEIAVKERIAHFKQVKDNKKTEKE